MRKFANLCCLSAPMFVFSKIKHKYNKRTHSFTIADEVILKKEMAVKCLLSATDQQSSDDVTRDSAMKMLIDDLYTKLNSLHLFSGDQLHVLIQFG